jgi:hypothetical protein
VLSLAGNAWLTGRSNAVAGGRVAQAAQSAVSASVAKRRAVRLEIFLVLLVLALALALAPMAASSIPRFRDTVIPLFRGLDTARHS